MENYGSDQNHDRGHHGVSHKLEVLSGWHVGPRYELVKYIGEGSYGQVAKAIDVRSGEPVAIKRIDSVFDNATDCKHLLRELILLKKLNHASIVRLLNVLIGDDDGDLENFNEIYLVMSYSTSDLRKLSQSNIALNITQIKSIIRSLT